MSVSKSTKYMFVSDVISCYSNGTQHNTSAVTDCSYNCRMLYEVTLLPIFMHSAATSYTQVLCNRTALSKWRLLLRADLYIVGDHTFIVYMHDTIFIT